MLPVASQQILAAWVGIGLLLIGLGSWFRWLCGAPAHGAAEVLRTFWLGWALLLLLLQVWHLFLPVDGRVLALLAVVALVGLLLGGWRPWLAILRGTGRHWLALLVLLASAVWLCNRALGGPRFGDVGLYHIPVVQWDSQYAIVPGLGNLFVPFGHNISYFLYVALLQIGPFAHRSYHVVNSILVLALIARGLLGLDRVLHLKRVCAPHDVFYALFLPLLVLQALGIFLTSPSPDQPLFLLGVVLCGELLGFVGQPSGRVPGRRVPNFDILAITLLATAAVTVKLSIAGLAAAVLFLAVAQWAWRDRPSGWEGWSTLVAATALGAFGTGLWMLGNIILTGCPLYPSAFAAFPVEWRVQVDAIKFVDRSMSFGAPLWKVIWQWRWFLHRLDSLGWGDSEVLVSLSIALVSTLMAGILRLRWRHPAGRRVPMIILLPALASFAFTFATTPMPRYFGATLWILAVDGLVLAIGTAAFGVRRMGRAFVGALVLLGVGGVLLMHRPMLLPLHDFEPKPAPRVESVRLENGLVLQVAGETQTCWDAPLPCTPEPSPGLRLRRPGDLASGFVIDAKR